MEHSATSPSPSPPLPCPYDACLLYLVRHGATVANLAEPPVLQGRGVNYGLCEQGRWQAKQTAALLAEVEFKAVYSSTMMRARETAAVIAERRGLDVTKCDRLVEVDVGRWEGMTWSDIMRREPDAYRLFHEDPARHGYPQGESVEEVQRRATEAISELMQAHLGEPIVVVAHAVVNRMFLAGALGLPVKQGRELSQDNCGVNVVRLRDHALKVLTLNSVFHLSAEARESEVQP